MEYMKARFKRINDNKSSIELHYLAGPEQGKVLSAPYQCASLLELIFDFADRGWRLLFSEGEFHFFERAEQCDAIQVAEGWTRPHDFDAPANRGLDGMVGSGGLAQ